MKLILTLKKLDNKPIILSLIAFALTYHAMYELTSVMFEYPEEYCLVNAEHHQYNLCTRIVIMGKFSVVIMPILTALGSYAIFKKMEQRRELTEQS